MQKPFRILFYENGDPMDPERIRRFVDTFSERYREVVQEIIEKSETLNEEIFKFNIATLMPSFKMTRRGIFHGLRIDKKGITNDPNGVVDLCWQRIGDKLLDLKKYIDEKVRGPRSRVLANLSSTSKDYVIQKTSELFRELLEVTVKRSEMSRVGASKVLFAVIPEIALPVDTSKWKYVFKTKQYGRVLSTMVKEINEWEKKTGTHLDTLDSPATLPSIYNVMAMAARP